LLTACAVVLFFVGPLLVWIVPSPRAHLGTSGSWPDLRLRHENSKYLSFLRYLQRLLDRGCAFFDILQAGGNRKSQEPEEKEGISHHIKSMPDDIKSSHSEKREPKKPNQL
jgi:hypothetical protein